MFCPRCGAEIPDGMRVCPQCGADIARVMGGAGASSSSSDDETRPISDETRHMADGATRLMSDDETRPMSDGATRRMGDAPTSRMDAGMTQLMEDDGSAEAVDSLGRDTTEQVVAAAPPHHPDGDEGGAAENDEPASHKVRKPLVIALVVVAVLVAAGAAYGLTTGLIGGVSVPDVGGLSQDEATSKLEQAGLKADVSEQATDDGVGTVLSTDPAAGTTAKSGSTVKVVVGAARTIPTVKGKTLDDAKKALQDAGASNLKVLYVASDETEGTVVSCDPAEGATFKSTDTITLTIAQAYTVPDVIGMTTDAATKAVSDAGLTSTVVESASDKAAGTVLTTDPAAGTRVNAGDKVTITVAGASSVIDLASYLTDDPGATASGLESSGWTFEYGTVVGGTYAKEGFSKSGIGELVFTPEPFSHHNGAFGETSLDVMVADGAQIAGVRFEPTVTGVFSDVTYDRAGVMSCLKACGLSDPSLDSFCDQDSIIATGLGSDPSSETFACGVATDGGKTWTAFILKGSDGMSIAVTCAPTSLYDSVSLEHFGQQLANYVAYVDGFTE
ncbi:MAG: PASTA domain-containing protein [Atopobiaceae bacterium]|nr:PASTA domain-containing protein [Atopobiaceae bacterium]MCI2172828.1 PASTA domain-containing protein [Atopobiaceae bacterium]MCI2207135.1 PASTA domain-containing protein [Atopobiaceae bacterium]